MKKWILLLFVGGMQSLVWAQGGALKIEVSKGVEKDIERDCTSEVLDAFLWNGNKPVESIAGFMLKQVHCSFDSVTLGYQKEDHSISISLKDNQAIIGSDGKNNIAVKDGKEKGLAEMQVEMQKANLKVYEDNITAFEELKIKLPEVAVKQEKDSPPPGKYMLPSGETLYFRRKPCKEMCGVVEANAMIRGARYYFRLHAEYDGASLSQQAAREFVKEVIQTVKWETL